MTITRPLVGLGVLIFNEHNQILLGKPTASHGRSGWGSPGGHLEFGESLEECASKEIQEEIDLKMDTFEFAALTNDVFVEDGKHYISIFMKAKLPAGQEVQNLEPHKIERWGWFGRESLPKDLFLPLKNLLDGRGYGLKASLFQI